MTKEFLWDTNMEAKAKQSLPYIQQTEEYGYSCCAAISIMNAAIYYGLDVVHPEKDRKAWEMLVDAWACRHGSALNLEWTFNHFKMKPIPIPTEEWAYIYCLKNNIPIITSIGHKTSGKGMHSCLVIDYEGEDEDISLCLVNAQPQGELVQKWKWDDIDFQVEIAPILHWASRAILLEPKYRSFMPEDETSSDKEQSFHVIKEYENAKLVELPNGTRLVMFKPEFVEKLNLK